MIAACNNNIELVNVLLDETGMTDGNGTTALIYAILNDSKECVNCLKKEANI